MTTTVDTSATRRPALWRAPIAARATASATETDQPTPRLVVQQPDPLPIAARRLEVHGDVEAVVDEVDPEVEQQPKASRYAMSTAE